MILLIRRYTVDESRCHTMYTRHIYIPKVCVISVGKIALALWLNFLRVNYTLSVCFIRHLMLSYREKAALKLFVLWPTPSVPKRKFNFITPVFVSRRSFAIFKHSS